MAAAKTFEWALMMPRSATRLGYQFRNRRPRLLHRSSSPTPILTHPERFRFDSTQRGARNCIDYDIHIIDRLIAIYGE